MLSRGTVALLAVGKGLQGLIPFGEKGITGMLLSMARGMAQQGSCILQLLSQKCYP